MPPFKTYLFEYEFDGAMWTFEVKAATEQEAVRRVRSLSSHALLLVEQVCSVPAFPGSGLLVRLISWLRSLKEFF